MSIFSKLREFVGLNDPIEYEYDEYEDNGNSDGYRNTYQQEQVQSMPDDERNGRRRMRERISVASDNNETGTPLNNVIGMPGTNNSTYEVVVMEPRTFEEMPQAIQALLDRKSVVLNLTMLDPDQAQRAVDFVAGGTYAINGHQERVGESIFLFTPICVQVTTQSGGVNEAVQAQARTGRSTVPTPSWTPESTRIAQSS
ncbi:cell division protein SepF [Synechocystis sp. PCC 7509]|uniref:cell division protein SepF n=1 Tax=Synechocystis sp. PCC 7509 TaxID=927677 RepID=UPI0002AC38B7|nr:cell division protein SepF [Synechocystis sp. PCC 7509]